MKRTQNFQGIFKQSPYFSEHMTSVYKIQTYFDYTTLELKKPQSMGQIKCLILQFFRKEIFQNIKKKLLTMVRFETEYRCQNSNVLTTLSCVRING